MLPREVVLGGGSRQRILERLAELEGVDFQTTWLCAAAQVNKTQVRRTFAKLERAGMISQVTRGRWFVHMHQAWHVIRELP